MQVNEFYNIKALFAEKGCAGANDIYICAYKNPQKNQGMAEGMEYPYFGLMMDATDNGIGIFYIENKDPATLLVLSMKKAEILPDSFFFIPYSDMRMTVKNFNIFNKNTKRITLEQLSNGKVHYLQAMVGDKMAVYNLDMIPKFSARFEKK